jgi:hypothetical protein
VLNLRVGGEDPELRRKVRRHGLVPRLGLPDFGATYLLRRRLTSPKGVLRHYGSCVETRDHLHEAVSLQTRDIIVEKDSAVGRVAAFKLVFVQVPCGNSLSRRLQSGFSRQSLAQSKCVSRFNPLSSCTRD